MVWLPWNHEDMFIARSTRLTVMVSPLHGSRTGGGKETCVIGTVDGTTRGRLGALWRELGSAIVAANDVPCSVNRGIARRM